MPFDGELVHLSNVVLVIPGIEYVLPFDNLIVIILFGRLYVKSVIHVDSTGFSVKNSIALIELSRSKYTIYHEWCQVDYRRNGSGVSVTEIIAFGIVIGAVIAEVVSILYIHASIEDFSI